MATGMWAMLQQVMGTPWAGVTAFERQFMMALAGTGVIIAIKSVFELIILMGKGGWR